MRTESMRTTIDQVRETLLGGPNCPHMMLSLENISCVYLMHTKEVLACVPFSTWVLLLPGKQGDLPETR